jgi:hypothetical protein
LRRACGPTTDGRSDGGTAGARRRWSQPRRDARTSAQKAGILSGFARRSLEVTMIGPAVACVEAKAWQTKRQLAIGKGQVTFAKLMKIFNRSAFSKKHPKNERAYGERNGRGFSSVLGPRNHGAARHRVDQ